MNFLPSGDLNSPPSERNIPAIWVPDDPIAAPNTDAACVYEEAVAYTTLETFAAFFALTTAAPNSAAVATSNAGGKNTVTAHSMLPVRLMPQSNHEESAGGSGR